MAHESFEDPDVAGLLNQILHLHKSGPGKERPDIDQMYMAAAIGMTGRGGWPLTIVMTPEKKPFFAALTYPKRSLWPGGNDGAHPSDHRYLDSKRNELLGSADRIVDCLCAITGIKSRHLGTRMPQSLPEAIKTWPTCTMSKTAGLWDCHPNSRAHNILFLLRYWLRTGDDQL